MLSHLRRRCRRDEDGSSLILALIIVSILAVGSAALLSFVDTSIRTTVAVQSQGNSAYAADAAVQIDINTLRKTPSGTVSAGCAPLTSTVDSVTVRVDCTPLPGSGSLGDGGKGTTPPAAVILLGRNPAGSGSGQENDFELVNPNSSVTITGIQSAQNITLDNQTTLNIDNQPTSTAASVSGPATCNLVGSGTIQPPAAAKCGTLTSVIDPGYGLPSYASVITQTVTDLGSSCNNKINVLQPGEYNDSLTWQPGGGGALTGESALAGYLTCVGSSPGNKGTIFWFPPGFYYFNFSTDATPMLLNAQNDVYVAGTPTGWDPTSPSVNVSAVQALAQNGQSCDHTGTSTSPQGSEFVFGRSARLGITSGTFEFCPWFDTTNAANTARISFYGVPSTTGGWTAQSGCGIAVGLCGGGVTAWLNLQSSGGGGITQFLTAWGTIYAPKASVDVNLPSQAQNPLFDRGIVSRIFRVDRTTASGLASSISCGPLGCGAGPPGPRSVLLRAYNSSTGKLLLQSLVTFDDNNQTTWGRQVTVTAWSVNR